MVERASLAGRDAELARIDTFLVQVRLGGAALCLWGDPGAGKTTLLDAAAHAAAGLGMCVRRAAGSELERDLDYATLHELQYPLAPDLGGLPAGMRAALTVALGLAAGPPPDPALVAAAVSTLARPAGDEPATVIVVDDLQWVDPASLAVLELIGRGAAGARIGLLTATRGDPPPALAALGSLEAGPLDEAAAAALVDAALRPAKAVRDQLLAAARGNPLALRELGSTLDDDQRHGRRRGPALSLPPGRLRRAHAADVAALPEPARRTLLIAALNDSDDIDLPDAEADLEPARRARIVVTDPGTGRPRFRNPLLRAAVLAASTSQERTGAHRELARIFAAVPQRRAWHLAEASLRPDETVAGLLEEGARQSLREGQVMAAVDALLRAADLSTTPAGRSGRLAQAAYISASVHGELAITPDLLDAARRAQPDGRLSLPVAVAAAQVLLNVHGDVDTAHRLLRAALDATGPVLDAGDGGVLDALFELMDVCRYAGRAELWGPLDAQLARLRPAVPPLARLRAHALRGPALVTDADLAAMDELIRGFGAETDPARINRIATTALTLDRGPACHPALWRVIEDGRAGGAGRTAIAGLFTIAEDRFAAGDWAGTRAAVDEGLRMCEAGGYRLPAQLGRVIHLQLAAACGDDDTVRRLGGELTAWGAARGLGSVLFRCHEMLALAAVGRSDFAEAYHHSTAITEPGVLPSASFAIRSAPDLVEAALRIGRGDEARAHVRALRESGVDRVSDRLALMVAGTTAMVAGHDDLFARALALPGARRYPWDTARIRLLYGERLRRARAMSRARAELTAALATFRELGANPWADRATRELAATSGTRNRVAGPGPSPLTPQELQVAELAAAGLTNKEVAARLLLSHRTVAAHLRQAYRKLGISSRGALRDALGAAR